MWRPLGHIGPRTRVVAREAVRRAAGLEQHGTDQEYPEEHVQRDHAPDTGDCESFNSQQRQQHHAGRGGEPGIALDACLREGRAGGGAVGVHVRAHFESRLWLSCTVPELSTPPWYGQLDNGVGSWGWAAARCVRNRRAGGLTRAMQVERNRQSFSAILEGMSTLQDTLFAPPESAARTSVRTPVGGPSRMTGRHASVRVPRVPAWWRDAFGVFVWSSLLGVVALWVVGGGVQGLASAGSGLTSVG